MCSTSIVRRSSTTASLPNISLIFNIFWTAAGAVQLREARVVMSEVLTRPHKKNARGPNALIQSPNRNEMIRVFFQPIGSLLCRRIHVQAVLFVQASNAPACFEPAEALVTQTPAFVLDARVDRFRQFSHRLADVDLATGCFDDVKRRHVFFVSEGEKKNLDLNETKLARGETSASNIWHVDFVAAPLRANLALGVC